jgi:hypothetical protein
MSKLFEESQIITLLGDEYIDQNGLNAFHIKARELLENAELPKYFNFQELVERSLNAKFEIPQTYRYSEFSDFPLTLARGKHCFIDVYFWRRRPTAVHNHHFRGAFQCLKGFNVDLEYTYLPEKSLGEHHSVGELKLIGTRNLKPGDVVSINFLDKFIHQNHHQDELTVNLCFRTPEEDQNNISNYLLSGLRFEKESGLLMRVERLKKLCALDDFHIENLELSHDEAINFLIQTYETGTKNTRILRLQDFFKNKLLFELNLDIYQLLDEHDKKIAEMEDLYE